MGNNIQTVKQNLQYQIKQTQLSMDNTQQKIVTISKAIENNLQIGFNMIQHTDEKQNELQKKIQQQEEKYHKLYETHQQTQKQSLAIQNQLKNFQNSQVQEKYDYDLQIQFSKLDDLKKNISIKYFNRSNQNKFQYFAGFLGRVSSGKTWFLNKISQKKTDRECSFLKTEPGLNLDYFKNIFCHIDIPGPNSVDLCQLNEQSQFQIFEQQNKQLFRNIITQFILEYSLIIYIMIKSPANLEDYSYLKNVVNQIKLIKRDQLYQTQQQYIFVIHNFQNAYSKEICEQQFYQQLNYFGCNISQQNKKDHDFQFLQKINDQIQIQHEALLDNKTEYGKQINSKFLLKLNNIYAARENLDTQFQQKQIFDIFAQFLNLNIQNYFKFQQASMCQYEFLQQQAEEIILQSKILPILEKQILQNFGCLQQNEGIHFVIPQFLMNENDQFFTVELQFSSLEGVLDIELINYDDCYILQIQGFYDNNKLLSSLLPQNNQQSMKQYQITKNNFNQGYFQFGLFICKISQQIGEIQIEKIEGATIIKIDKISLI